MGMSGNFNGLKPPTKLISGLYHQGKDTDDDGNRIDGICANCEQWDAELVNGYCRDDECKQDRLNKRVEAGEAISISTDVIGKDGKVGTAIKRGNKGYFVGRED